MEWFCLSDGRLGKLLPETNLRHLHPNHREPGERGRLSWQLLHVPDCGVELRDLVQRQRTASWAQRESVHRAHLRNAEHARNLLCDTFRCEPCRHRERTTHC